MESYPLIRFDNSQRNTQVTGGNEPEEDEGKDEFSFLDQAQ